MNFYSRSRQFVFLRYKSNCSAVVSNGKECAAVGTRMLAEGGSAIDAAIATLLCEGVVLPYCMGIGGGFVATIYKRSQGKMETLIARETAPLAAHKNMFLGMPQVTGALSCAVPGEIMGYWQLHQRFGRLPWKKLFESAIKLAKDGHTISEYVANALKLKEAVIRQEPSLKCLYTRNNKLLTTGDNICYEVLGATLETIAEQGVECMYGGGEIGVKFVEDVQKMGGIITIKDLLNYRVRWGRPVSTKFADCYTCYSTPLPTSGVLIMFILNIMNELYTKDTNLYYHRVIEAFKHAFGQRTQLGDFEKDAENAGLIRHALKQILSTSFARTVSSLINDDCTDDDITHYGAQFVQVNDAGTANVAALESNGDAITITSTINTKFAAKVRSCQTGILLNDEMDDFCTPGIVNNFGIPASPANYIYPGKIPLSSMCPSIVLDNDGNVRLLVGGAGGSNIITAVSMTIIRYLILEQTLPAAVNDGRLHHQLLPNQLEIEHEVPKPLIQYLATRGHKIKMLEKGNVGSAITAIGVQNDKPTPVYDKRRVGSTSCVKNKKSTFEILTRPPRHK